MVTIPGLGRMRLGNLNTRRPGRGCRSLSATDSDFKLGPDPEVGHRRAALRDGPVPVPAAAPAGASATAAGLGPCTVASAAARRPGRFLAGPLRLTRTAWKNEKELVRSELKSPTISTLFQRSAGGVDKCYFRVLSGGGKKIKAIQTTKGITAATRTP